MKFAVVAQALGALEEASSRLKITAGLAELFFQASPEESRELSYLLLGNLYPKYKSTTFNFAEKNLVEMLVAVIAQGSQKQPGKGPDENQLSFLKTEEALSVEPAALKEFVRRAKELGDLGDAVEEALLMRSQVVGPTENLSLSEVFEALRAIESIEGTRSQVRKSDEFLPLFVKLDPVSAKYLVRIILGKLRLGFSEMTLLDALSWAEVGDKSLRKDLEAAYNISADIGLLAYTLKKTGVEGVKEIKATPGIPIRPAAAERLESAYAIVEKLGPCVAQPKLDGLRLQVHAYLEDGKQVVHFFSRNLQDVTPMFPELKDAIGKLASKRFIAEGEALAFDPVSGAFLAFQETAKRRRKQGVEQALERRPMRLYLFDCLYEGENLLLGESHSIRRKHLENMVGSYDETSTVQVIEERSFDDGAELEIYFDEQMAQGREGLIAKRIDAPYLAGKRNLNWIKLKRVENGSLDDTIDAVVLGYYQGKGKRAGFGIGALLVGLYNKEKDCFESVAKIGTGLSDSQWREYKKLCDEISVDSQPTTVVVAKELSPDVWVKPHIVVVVRADEISRSPLHSAGATGTVGGLALRFPRVIERRQDKSPSDATTTSELENLRQLQEKKRV